ncbi:hypothetical protein [[Clostridium] polysaccharolyticum]|uniref:Lipocalin-like domain-containing protein n=1 Tax=[Clostridium] polysaccharolyticum TaxID=29364 RepID=A0A1I0CIG1_9FIRM|nr:hypothetical protein [[Clostridium] polysaccharolyticum]SET19214.1 hypothetical protein SAMN04487772_11021 [[Clostridium] polysaccharolyticum]
MKKKLFAFCLTATMLLATACSGKDMQTAGKETFLSSTYIAAEANEAGIEKWSFTKDGQLTMINEYGYTKEQREDSMLVSLAKPEEKKGMPSFSCTIKNLDGKYVFTQVQNGMEIQPSASQFELESGDDGLSSTDPFEGTFKNESMGVNYKFLADGTMDLETVAAYSITDGRIIISTSSVSGEYGIKISKNQKEMTVTVEGEKVILKKS